MASDSAGVGSLLPSQAGQASGNILTTDGFAASWEAVPAGAGVTIVGTFGSTPTANAATISGVSIFFQPADGTHPGSVTTGAQTFGGAKTFSGGVIATLTGNATTATSATTATTALALTGDVTAAASSSETITGNIADGASAVAVIVNNSVALSNATAKPLSIRTNAVEKAYFDSGGNLFTGVGGQACNFGTIAGAPGFALSSSNALGASNPYMTVISSLIYFNAPSGHNIRVNNVDHVKISTSLLDLSTVPALQIKCSYTASQAAGTTDTANTATGRFTLASGSSAITVTCSPCSSTTSVVMVQNETAMGTALQYKVVPGNGSFVVTTAAAAPTDLVFSFICITT